MRLHLLLDKMRVGATGQLESPAQVRWRFAGAAEVGLGADKAARLRGLRLALQGGQTARNGCPTVACATGGGRTGRNGCRAVEWAGREKEEWQHIENIEITNNINKLDKDTLNLYTAR